MNADVHNCGWARGVIGRAMPPVFAAAMILMPGWAARGGDSSEPESTSQPPTTTETHAHMSEALRSSVRTVVVVAGQRPADKAVSGSYEKETPGLVAGIDAGARMGTITKEVGDVAVNFPIPILTIPGAIYGGLSGAAKREIQEFRDALTDELAKAGSRPLTNDGLALDVYSGLRRLPNLDAKLFAPTTPVPTDTDAVLYVNFDDVAIDVQGKEAIITSSANAKLHRLSDGEDLYDTVVRYQDRDTLSNWTNNDNALWRDYANFARLYLGREISAEVFGRVELQYELIPKETDTAARDRKDERQFVSRSPSPTLAWELTSSGGDSAGSRAAASGDADIFYDLEIYDNHRPVYAEEQIPEPRYTIAIELDPCRTYRWSVRPSYHADGEIKFGEWMRIKPDAVADSGNGIVGRNASEAPAYIQDFALLKIQCGRR
jgi:hypothetical protein